MTSHFTMIYLCVDPRTLLVFVCLSLFSGCSTTQPSSKIETGSRLSKDAKLAGRTTFRFLPNRVMEAAEAVSNAPYWYSQIGKVIAHRPLEKRLSPSGSAKSDLLVAYHLVLKRTQAVTILNNYSGYDLSRSEIAQTDLAKFTDPKKPGEAPLGLLIIDIIDPTHRQLLWRGWAKTNLTGIRDPNRLSGLIADVVARTLADFPPKS
jgi:hypothetical protein